MRQGSAGFVNNLPRNAARSSRKPTADALAKRPDRKNRIDPGTAVRANPYVVLPPPVEAGKRHINAIRPL
jgi:hypothetical protein